MATMICRMCGKEVERTSNGQKYCEECRIKKQAERNNAYQKRKENGTVNSIGSTAICQECGNEFIRTSGNQRLCTECIQKGIVIKKKLSELPEEERRKEYSKTAEIKNKLYDTLKIYIPKGKKIELQELSKICGISLNAFVNQAITFYEQQIRSEIDQNPDE